MNLSQIKQGLASYHYEIKVLNRLRCIRHWPHHKFLVSTLADVLVATRPFNLLSGCWDGLSDKALVEVINEAVIKFNDFKPNPKQSLDIDDFIGIGYVTEDELLDSYANSKINSLFVLCILYKELEERNSHRARKGQKALA